MDTAVHPPPENPGFRGCRHLPRHEPELETAALSLDVEVLRTPHVAIFWPPCSLTWD